jgi:protein AaeX
MPREIELFSLLVPALVPILACCVLGYVVLDTACAKLGIYRFVWHPSLFRVALFAALFSGASLLLGQ